MNIKSPGLWYKLYVSVFRSEKTLYIKRQKGGREIMFLWFELLALALEQNNGGVLINPIGGPFTEEDFIGAFNEPKKLVNAAFAVFKQTGMIEIINGTVVIPNWEKYQNIDAFEKAKEKNKERQARYKSKQKQQTFEIKASNNKNNVTNNVIDNAEITVSNAIDKDIRIRNYSILERVNNKSIFKAPTLEEVKAYVKEIGSGIDPERFFNHYKANGWHIGKVPMEDWKAAVQKWTVSEDKLYGGKKKKPEPSYDIDQIEKTIFKNGISEEDENESNKV